MKKLYCPRCGFRNDPKNRFCKHCGFNLVSYKQQMDNRSSSLMTRENLTHQRSIHQRSMGYYEPQFSVPRKHHHAELIVSLVIIVIIIALSLGGLGTYEANIWPFGNGPFNSVSKQNTRENANADYSKVKQLWGGVNSYVHSKSGTKDDSDYDPLFKDTYNNKADKLMNEWCNMINNSRQINGTVVESITPYDFHYIGEGKVSYRVRYDFRTHSHDHIQEYYWRTKIRNGKIISMFNNSKPIKDYDN